MKQARSQTISVFVSGVLVTLLFAGALHAQSKVPGTDLTPGATVPATDNKRLYKIAIERYFNAYIKADLDTLLDSLDAKGPMYPQPAAIKKLRATSSGNALQGSAVVKDLSVLEESQGKARVRVTLFMRVDIYSNGKFREETSHPTCELTLKDGKWRLFNAKTQ